jgi:hypothetical protein
LTAILWSWAVSAVALIMLAVALGRRVFLPPGNVRPRPWWLGILIDDRGRFSLNRLQLVLWSLVVASLVSGVFFGRLVEGVAEPLEFTIPERVLGLIGISIGAAVTVGAMKATKKTEAESATVGPAPAAVVAQGARAGIRLATYQATGRPPFLGQIFMAEEGSYADDTVDVTKFQSFAFTIVLVVAYVAMAINTIVEAKTAAHVTALPDIKGTFLVLLAISYAGYGGGKLKSASGVPRAGF